MQPNISKTEVVQSTLDGAIDSGKKTLNADQQATFIGVCDFVLNPSENFMVIEGGPGTGKSTMIEHIFHSFERIQNLQKLMGVPPLTNIILTATTHKAAAVISEITQQPTATIQSTLGLRLNTDYSVKPPKSELVPTKRTVPIENALIIIDEMSYVDKSVNAYLKAMCKKSKVILIGDYEQILGVREKSPVIQKEGYLTHTLTKIERRGDLDGATHPITQMGYSFRDLIQGKPFIKTPIDGKTIIRAKDEDEFEQYVISEFSRPDWRSTDSRIIAWQNTTVQVYNQYVHQLRGKDSFNAGDIVVSNKFVKLGNNGIANNAELPILGIEQDVYKHGPYSVPGWRVTLPVGTGFMPSDSDAVKKMLAYAHNIGDFALKAMISENWLDLRHPYASTADKSQGSTFNKVFIDLNDLNLCRQKDRLKRMLYVAITRARSQVVLVGDIQI
jgi:hypothetical protein